MLELLALALEDGWAYVRRDDVILLARPPYRRDALLPVAESALEAAVTKHGFMAADRKFADWEQLTTYLRQRVEETQVEASSPEAIGQAYWGVADERDITLALTHVEEDLLTSGEYGNAERLLRAMVDHSPALESHASLAERATRLLSQVPVQENRRRADLTVHDPSIAARATKQYTPEKLAVWQQDFPRKASGSAALSRPNG